jgi:hypothetical protein
MPLRSLLNSARRRQKIRNGVEIAAYIATLLSNPTLMFFLPSAGNRYAIGGALYLDRAGAERLNDPGAIQDLCLRPDT